MSIRYLILSLIQLSLLAVLGLTLVKTTYSIAQTDLETENDFFDEGGTADSASDTEITEPVDLGTEDSEASEDLEAETQVNSTGPSTQTQSQKQKLEFRYQPKSIFIEHPYGPKGLTKITSEKKYIYEVPPSSQRHAMSLRFGVYQPDNLVNPDTGSTFEDNYDSTEAPIVFFEYDWQFLRGALGKFGLKAGTGIFAANGNGRFKNSDTIVENQGKTPKEVFTFLVFPNSLGLIYRLQFWDEQLFVPYAEGGLNVFTFAEFRDDDQGAKFGAALGAYAGGGLAMNMTYFDSISRAELDREYGINRVYVTGEYRQIVGLNQDYDFGAGVINAGILVEY